MSPGPPTDRDQLLLLLLWLTTANALGLKAGGGDGTQRELGSRPPPMHRRALLQQLALASAGLPACAVAAPTRASDEFDIAFDSAAPLGLQLRDLRVGFEYGTREGTSRVLVADVVPGGQAPAAANPTVGIDDIVVAVDGVNVERDSAASVQARIERARAAGRQLTLTFKDPLEFNQRLNAPPAAGSLKEQDRAPVSTVIAPGRSQEDRQQQVTHHTYIYTCIHS